MKRCPGYSLTLLLALAATPAWAVSVYKCQDSKGSISYEAHCPPGTTPVDQKDYRADGGAPEEGPRASVTIYLVPNCDTCDQVKEFLAVRNIRPVEKNVASDVKLQEELKAKAGDLRVPVTVIGDRVVNGYNRTEMLSALEAGGYGEAGAGSGGTEAAEEAETTEEETMEEAPAEEATAAE
jgi:glutaredoxin